MSKTELHFKRPGMYTTIQDSGRIGYEAFGVAVSGSLDNKCACIANQLVSNSESNPLLEITLIGPEIEFVGNCSIAITGAEMNPKINGREVSMYETVRLSNGDILSFEQANAGCRAYLAVGGIWQVKHWLGSASASPYHAKPLTPDSVIEKGSKIQIEANETSLNQSDYRPVLSNVVRVRVMKGPEFSSFSKEAIAQFFGTPHRLTSESNRMGYQLSTKLPFECHAELISSGIVAGTIQVTNDGKPIILLADAQTTGGYYRIANVIAEDIDQLAQLKPGDVIWFSLYGNI